MGYPEMMRDIMDQVRREETGKRGNGLEDSLSVPMHPSDAGWTKRPRREMIMMKTFSKDELKSLMAKQEGFCISIFMPTYRVGASAQQNQIRLRNMLRAAEEKLLAGGCRPQETKTLLEPVQGLIRNVIFWRHQSDGLAVFLSSNTFLYYRIPTSLEELIVVADRFHIKPLLPVLSGDNRFYVLTLSQNEIHLFEGTKQDMREIEIDTVARSLAEALQYDELEKQVRFHRGAPRGGERSSMVSGHGADLDDNKENILKYFRQIDKGLRDFLRDERIPLVLAGVDYLFPIYKEVNTYANLVGEGITGNPKGMSMEQLHRQAWSIVDPYFQKDENDAVAQYRQSSGTGLTSKAIREIIPAAYHGRVGLLFITRGYQQWGIFDPASNEIHLHDKMEAGSEGLPDLAAIQTFLSGGTVFILPPEKMPDEASLAAVFRY